MNQMGHTDSHQVNPSLRILVTALVVGSISFVVSLFSVSFNVGSDPNFAHLAPVAAIFSGIFVTGPVGTLVGALIGIVWSALRAGERRIRAEVWWLGSIWGLTLLYTLLVPLRGLILALGLQGLVVASGAFLLGHNTVRRSLPQPARKCGPALLCAAVLIVLTSMFPPVVPEQARSSEALPKFAFFMDSRFDASQHSAEFAIAKQELAREWFIVAGAAGVVCLFIGMRGKRRRTQLTE